MANTRKPISKKLRFEIFKRDGFSCKYCNAKPPNVSLEIDHIVPVSKGGNNSQDNLITACFDCNRGKSAISLDCVTDSMAQKMERKKEALKQYNEYLKVIAKENDQMEHDIRQVEKVFKSFFPKYSFSDKFNVSVKGFIEKLGVVDCVKAMEYACRKHISLDDTTKYFCGICWCKIKER